MSKPTSPESLIRADVPATRAFVAEIEWVSVVEPTEPTEPTEVTERSADEGSLPLTRAKAPNGEDYHMRVVMSTEDVASDGGIILASGWKLERFLRNPVFLWAHEYHTAPIGRLVHVEVRGKKLIGWVLFDEGDEFAAQIKRKYENGFLYAVSVGFVPRKIRTCWRDELTKQELEKGACWVSDETELLELSSVPVPADSKALKYAADSTARADEPAAPVEPAAEIATSGSEEGEPAPEIVDPADAETPAPSGDTAGERAEETPSVTAHEVVEQLVRQYRIRLLVEQAAR